MVKIPRRLDDILPTLTMEKLLDVLQQPDISGKVREALHQVGLHDAAPIDRVREAWQQARGWLDSVTESVAGATTYPRALNGSGQMLSSSFVAVPWGTVVAYEFAKVATDYQSHSNLMRQAEELTRRQFGNQATTYLSSTSEALRLLASSPAASDGVVVARVDAVRIAGLGDIRSMLAAATNPLVEIGAANGVRAEEWSQALRSPRQMVVLASPNNLPLKERRQLRLDAIAAAKACGAKVIEVLADGVVSPPLIEHYQFPDVAQACESGADVVILPSQFLLGGPLGAVVIGQQELVSRLHAKADEIGVLLSGAQLLAVVSAIKNAAKQEPDQASVADYLMANPENLRNRARRLAVQLTEMGEVGQAVECELTTPLGPSPWNNYQLQSWGVRLSPRNSLAELVRQVARGESKNGLQLEVIREAESLAISLRFIPPQYDHEIVLIVGGSTAAGKPEEAAST